MLILLTLFDVMFCWEHYWEHRTFAREQQIVNFRLTPKICECYSTRVGSQRLPRVLYGIEVMFK